MFFRSVVGIDIVEVSRFKDFSKEHHFLQKVFTAYELDYCFLHKDPSTHLAGIFSAKEAVSKALGVTKFPFASIEIKHDSFGKPEAYVGNKKLSISISIAHTDTIATSVAMG